MKTIGYEKNTEDLSEETQIKIELDKIKITDRIIVNSTENMISVILDKENLPSGKYDSIRVKCEDLEVGESDIVTEFVSCITEKSLGVNCSCNNLISGSSFRVTLDTYKSPGWEPQSVILSKTYNTSNATK